MLLSVIFSFRNEGANLEELVSRVDKAILNISEIKYELIFINDASTDNSLELLIQLAKKYPITIINMSRKFGVTPCVLAGFEYAKGDAIIYMDSDLQDPPELIGEMVSRFRNGAQVVHTTRTHREGEGIVKMALTKIAYKVINKFSEIKLPENTGDFKLLSAKVVNHILSLNEFDPYMRGLSIWVGYEQDYIFYTRQPRWAGKTKFPLLSRGPVLEFLRGMTAYSAAPLYMALLAGIVALIVAVLLMVYAIITKILNIAAPGTSSVLIAISFFGGMILITNGVMGIYISKIYYQVKQRPKFIIESILKSNIHEEL
jgi:glycosyltransferase involved in cell wall biosynthesis